MFYCGFNVLLRQKPGDFFLQNFMFMKKFTIPESLLRFVFLQKTLDT